VMNGDHLLLPLCPSVCLAARIGSGNREAIAGLT
jgi:hypothetical protein